MESIKCSSSHRLMIVSGHAGVVDGGGGGGRGG